MLDMGFGDDIKTLQEYLPEAQTMIFSATVPEYIQDIAMKKLNNPILLDLVGTDTTQIPKQIKNICLICNSDSQKRIMLKDFVSKNKDKKIIVFTETKDDAKQICSLQYAKFMGLHGDMDQRRRS